jgi:hypothetical protein
MACYVRTELTIEELRVEFLPKTCVGLLPVLSPSFIKKSFDVFTI